MFEGVNSLPRVAMATALGSTGRGGVRLSGPRPLDGLEFCVAVTVEPGAASQTLEVADSHRQAVPGRGGPTPTRTLGGPRSYLASAVIF